MSYSDTHCHLYLSAFSDDLPQVLLRSAAAEVIRLFLPGIDLPTSRQALEMSQQLPVEAYAAVGIHPETASPWNSDTLQVLADLAGSPRVAAIGEIGLDYYHESVPRSIQQDRFAAQLNLAAELHLPVIVHSRDSLQDCAHIIHGSTLPAAHRSTGFPAGIMHAFEGDVEDALALIDAGFLIGIGGPVTYKKASRVHRLVKHLPLDALVLETDSPYLPPVPHRGERNEPAYVPLIAEAILANRGGGLESLQAQIESNVDRFLQSSRQHRLCASQQH